MPGKPVPRHAPSWHVSGTEAKEKVSAKALREDDLFYSLADFGGQLTAHQNRSNNLPMRPLRLLSPTEFLHAFTVQNV